MIVNLFGTPNLLEPGSPHDKKEKLKKNGLQLQYKKKLLEKMMQESVIYIYSKCSTCQKALKFLAKSKEKFIIKEIKEEPPSLEELKRMLDFQQGNLKKLFNTSGMLYREMHLTEKLKEMPQRDALKLLSTHGMLVKRPFLIGDNFGTTGFNEKEWSALLNIKG